MSETQRILNQYDIVMHGSAWHGDAIWQILGGISAETAALRPIANAHSIWEIVGHMAFWEGATAKRLAGLRAGREEERNFPATPDITDANWQRPSTISAPPTRHSGRRCKNSVLPDWTSCRPPASGRFTQRRTG